MAVVTQDEVQSWLEATKLTLDAFDSDLENTAKTVVFSNLSPIFDISTWADATTTPQLVSDVVAMLVAAWTYRRAYSEEETGGNSYATWLEDKANMLLESIKSGQVQLAEVPTVSTFNESIVFYPNDASGITDTTQAAKFSMGSVF